MLLVFLCLLPVLVSGKSTIHRPVLTTPCAAHVGPDVNDASAVVFVAIEKRFIVSDQRYLYVFDTAGTQLKKSASYVTCKGVSEGESLTLVDRCVGHSQTPALWRSIAGDSIGCPCIACPHAREHSLVVLARSPRLIKTSLRAGPYQTAMHARAVPHLAPPILWHPITAAWHHVPPALPLRRVHTLDAHFFLMLRPLHSLHAHHKPPHTLLGLARPRYKHFLRAVMHARAVPHLRAVMRLPVYITAAWHTCLPLACLVVIRVLASLS